jgi:hypothetical protein
MIRCIRNHHHLTTRTCTNASSRYKHGVADADDQRSEVDVAQRVQRRHLRQERQHHGDDDDEMVQLQVAMWRNVQVYYLNICSKSI